MKPTKFDIFISYRHDGGAQYARTLQLMLEKKGYRVFLDYDELRDGQFSPKIEAAIKGTTIYMILLSKGSMINCSSEGDWVRREIEIAIRENKRIIPVNPDGTFDGIPDDVPGFIKEAIGGTQYSEINFGQALNVTVDLMVKNRIKPYIRPNRHKWYWLLLIVVLIISIAIFWICKDKHDAEVARQEFQTLKDETTFHDEPISWSDDVTANQIKAVQELLQSMQAIDGGEFLQGALPLPDGSYDDKIEPEFETPAINMSVKSFYLCKFEVTIGQWNAVMCDNREGNPNEPIAAVSFENAKMFTKKLRDLTLIPFYIPTETQWEYAAKGANNPEGYVFAGSDNADIVAWYKANSNGVPHSDLRPTPTVNDLFNMSGNVSEWCDTRFRPYDDNIVYNDDNTMVIRGGNFDSELYELTVTHREPASPDTSIPTLGFRVAIDKNR